MYRCKYQTVDNHQFRNFKCSLRYIDISSIYKGGQRDNNNTSYHYKFENVNIKDGWLNYYSITAYDRGDPNSNLQSLESSIYSNKVQFFQKVQ